MLLSRASRGVLAALYRAPASGLVGPHHGAAAALVRSLSTSYPSDRKYKTSHEWVKLDGDVATVGITNHAQGQLGEIVFADLPDVGREVAAAEGTAAIESVKAAAEIYAPVGGEVVGVNKNLEDKPNLINEDPHDGGWMFQLKLSDPAEMDSLLDAEAYASTLKDEK